MGILILILILCILNYSNMRRIEKLERRIKDVEIDHIGKE